MDHHARITEATQTELRTAHDSLSTALTALQTARDYIAMGEHIGHAETLELFRALGTMEDSARKLKRRLYDSCSTYRIADAARPGGVQ